MKEKLKLFIERFNALSLRERLMFAAAVLLSMYMVLDLTIFTEVHKQRDHLVAQIKDLDKRNKELDSKILEISKELQLFNGSGDEVAINQVKDQLSHSNKALQDMVVQFVKPQEMVQVLREVLKDVKGLKLMRVKSTGVVNLLAAENEKSTAEYMSKYKQALQALKLYQGQVQLPGQAQLQGKVADYLKRREALENKPEELPQIYKHGILIELRGSYAATLQYLRMLESLPWKFYWEAMRFEMDEYPVARIIIVINTLSLNKEWVRV